MMNNLVSITQKLNFLSYVTHSFKGVNYVGKSQ